jgi:hypothetical protein
MEQPKVVIYARFTTDVDQKQINAVKNKINSFARMLDAKVVKQSWEIVQKGASSKKFNPLFDDCIKNGWGILTYDLKTLHEHRSGALHIVEEGAEMGVPIFFVDSDSAFKSILSI